MDLYDELIVNVPDFPVRGVHFKDITPLLEVPYGFERIILDLSRIIRDNHLEHTFNKILCADARGFIFGSVLARTFNKGLVLARKPGKLPRPGLSVSYGLEYGSSTLQISEYSINSNDKVLLVDDLLATGGSAKALYSLATMSGATVVGALFAIELRSLNGREALSCPVYSVVQYGVCPGESVTIDVSKIVEEDQLRYSGEITAVVKRIYKDTFVVDWDRDFITSEYEFSYDLIKEVTSNGKKRRFRR